MDKSLPLTSVTRVRLPYRRLVWVEFVVGSRLAPRMFLRFSDFPPSIKTNTSSARLERLGDNSLRRRQKIIRLLSSF